MIDELVSLVNWLEPLAREYAGVIALVGAMAALFAIPSPLRPLRPLLRRLARPKAPNPKLSDPPFGDRSLARYRTRAVPLLGRESALARLKAFALSERGFAQMQIAGVGGQGKSRLGYELTLWAKDQGWEAGLLEILQSALSGDANQ